MRLRRLAATLAVLALIAAGAATLPRLGRDVSPRPILVVRQTSSPTQAPAPEPPGPATSEPLLFPSLPPDSGPSAPPAADEPSPPRVAEIGPALSIPQLVPLPRPDAIIRPAGAEADPLRDVEAFLARNRQQADDSIKALTAESDQLKGRLAKIEAALARWRAVSAALKARPEALEEATALDGPADEPKKWVSPRDAEPASRRRPTPPPVDPSEPFLTPAPPPGDPESAPARTPRTRPAPEISPIDPT